MRVARALSRLRIGSARSGVRAGSRGAVPRHRGQSLSRVWERLDISFRAVGTRPYSTASGSGDTGDDLAALARAMDVAAAEQVFDLLKNERKLSTDDFNSMIAMHARNSDPLAAERYLEQLIETGATPDGPRLNIVVRTLAAEATGYIEKELNVGTDETDNLPGLTDEERQRKVDMALRANRWLRKALYLGERLSPQAANEALAALAVASRFDLCSKRLRELESTEVFLDDETAGLILRICRLSKAEGKSASELALTVVEHCDRHSIHLDSNARANAILVLINGNQMDAAEAQLRAANGAPGLGSQNASAIVRSYCKVGRMTEAWSLLESMERSQQAPNMSTLQKVIDLAAQTRFPYRAQQVFEKILERSDLKVNRYVYHALIEANMNDMHAAIEKFKEMRLNEFEPNQFTYRLVIQSCCKAADFELAKEIYVAATEESDIEFKARDYDWWIDLCGAAGDVEGMEYFVEQANKRGLQLNLANLAGSYAHAGAHSHWVAVMNSTQETSVQIDILRKVLRRIAGFKTTRDMVEPVVNILEIFELKGVEPDSSELRAILGSVWRHAQGDPKLELITWYRALTGGVLQGHSIAPMRPDAATFELLFESPAGMNVEFWLDEMAKYGVRCTPSLLSHALGATKKSVKQLKILERMEQDGVDAPQWVYRKVLDGATMEENGAVANKVIAYMEKSGFNLSANDVIKLMRIDAKRGRMEEMVTGLKRLKKIGAERAEEPYLLIARCAVQRKNGAFAENAFKECKQNGNVPSANLCAAVIAALLRDPRGTESRVLPYVEILSEAKRGVPPDALARLVGLLESRNFAKAASLL